MKAKIGNQIPTSSRLLPYKKTFGKDAINLYNSTGRKAQKWQENLINNILAYNSDDLFIHTKFGFSIPRRNGKNEVTIIREMWGLVNGEHILHTAHRTTTTHSAWERLYDLLVKANIPLEQPFRAYGKEHIKLKEGGGVIEFRTRTSKGGLGEGYDLLVIDEAQEYEDDQESALKYVVSDSKNPQTLFCGTPPTTTSSGMVFSRYRDNTLQGVGANSGWAEWSVETESDVYDRKLWYLTNPSLGTILTERKIMDEITNDDLDFNIQRLGLWTKFSLKSVISEIQWNLLQIKEKPKFEGNLYVGIKYGQDGTNVALSLAVKTNEDKIFVESIGCKSIRDGNEWIIKVLKSYPKIEKVIVDGALQDNLVKDMKEYGLKQPILPKVKEIIEANALFDKAVFNDELRHNGQPSLKVVATNCEKRNIGSNGGFGYKSQKPLNDIALLDSVILAHWLCKQKRVAKKQRITY